MMGCSIPAGATRRQSRSCAGQVVGQPAANLDESFQEAIDGLPFAIDGKIIAATPCPTSARRAGHMERLHQYTVYKLRPARTSKRYELRQNIRVLARSLDGLVDRRSNPEGLRLLGAEDLIPYGDITSPSHHITSCAHNVKAGRTVNPPGVRAEDTLFNDFQRPCASAAQLAGNPRGRI